MRSPGGEVAKSWEWREVAKLWEWPNTVGARAAVPPAIEACRCARGVGHYPAVTKLRRIVTALVVLVVLWLVVLLVAGLALEPRTRGRIASRLAESLQADATISDGNLALIRGQLDLSSLAVRRDDPIGHLSIAVADLTCALPPLGLALIDHDCRELALRGIRLETSTAALFHLKRPKRPPLHARRVVIDDARVELAASALLPSLGKVAVVIAHAEAGDTVFKTPLSWLFSLRTLRATVELPAGLTLHVDYAAGQLHVAGGIFGSTPIALPVALPVADLADDPRAELAKLVSVGKDLAERLVTRKAEDWLKSKLSRP